jgi:hypothetical protein
MFEVNPNYLSSSNRIKLISFAQGKSLKKIMIIRTPLENFPEGKDV